MNTRLVVSSRMACPGCHPTPRPGAWSTQCRAMLTKCASTPCTGIVQRRWGRSSAAPGKRSRTSAGIVSGRWPRSSARSTRLSINWTPLRNRCDRLAVPQSERHVHPGPVKQDQDLPGPRAVRPSRPRPPVFPGDEGAGRRVGKNLERGPQISHVESPPHDGVDQGTPYHVRGWSPSPARRLGCSPTSAARRRAPPGASCESRRCRPPSPAPPTAPSSQATTSAASEPSTRKSPDHVHVQCGGTSGTRPLVPACLAPSLRRLSTRGGDAAPAATDVQLSSCLISWQLDGT